MKQLFLITLLVAAVTARSQDTKQSYSMSLNEAISYALEHNYSAVNSTRDIDIAKAKKWETTAAGLPQINGAVDYTYNFVIPKSVVPAQFVDSTAALANLRRLNSVRSKALASAGL
ncbi:hypothetical protein [Flavobacterium sp. 3HN19-14]|uniref:hypothetical protein n=1 Tax=Flavobacterium sp. 3HN19-14 TaxID=3448133 RepID=UPI003EDEC680